MDRAGVFVALLSFGNWIRQMDELLAFCCTYTLIPRADASGKCIVSYEKLK